MSSAEIDAYLAGLPEDQAAALTQLRQSIRTLAPEAEEGLSYSVPAFRVDGKLLAGFSAAARHLSYLPHSGTVLAGLDPALLDGRSWSKGALRFTATDPLPRDLIAALLDARREELVRS